MDEDRKHACDESGETSFVGGCSAPGSKEATSTRPSTEASKDKKQQDPFTLGSDRLSKVDDPPHFMFLRSYGLLIFHVLNAS